MTDRAVSTVLDASACLLLIGAAVLTLSTAAPPSPDPAAGRAEETASVLATGTARANYTVDGTRRTVRGTLAGLLADAAVARGAEEAGRAAFAAAVRNATRPVLGGHGWRAQVVAEWRPYPGAGLGGEVRVGGTPPPAADVHAATLTVGSGLPSVREDARAAAGGGYDAVAAAVARGVVAGLFPPAETRAALRRGHVDRTRARYRRVGDRYGVEAGGVLIGRGPRRANDRLRAGMADHVAADLRGRFDSAAAAADAVRVGTVRITVRAWSP